MEEIQELKIELAILSTTVKDWMENSKVYRQTLCEKIDKIDNKFDNIPNFLGCEKEKDRTNKLEKDVSNLKVKASFFGAAFGFLAALLNKFLFQR